MKFMQLLPLGTRFREINGQLRNHSWQLTWNQKTEKREPFINEMTSHALLMTKAAKGIGRLKDWTSSLLRWSLGFADRVEA
jgi:hypothetical protein